MTKPERNEYAEFYSGYVEKVLDTEIFDSLTKVMNETDESLKNLTDEEACYSYAPGKWTIKELIQHIIDSERVFAYRAMRIARNDKTPLAGFDENEYAFQAKVDERNIDELRQELYLIRRSNELLFRSFTNDDLKRMGTANNFEISVRALVYITAGHALHHLEVLRKNYLKQFTPIKN